MDIFWNHTFHHWVRCILVSGDGEEHKLIKHYQPVVEHQATLAEWNTFVNVVQAKTDLKGKDSRELLTGLVQQTSLLEILPNLHKLAVIALVKPMSSADCERRFSALKRIKTRLRNRLSNRILSNLLMISIEGPELKDFDFKKAADVWGLKETEE